MRIVIILAFVWFIVFAYGKELPVLKISENHKYLVTQQQEPFFWLGGTAWELIHRLTKEEIDMYLTDRANKGFTVIQTVVLAELDGLNTPNAYGDKPLINNDPEKLNEKYFQLVDYVVHKAGELGMYVGLLPTWGDKFNVKWGAGPVIFNPQNAEKYCEILAKRYLNQTNIIWILGGDRLPENAEQFNIVRSMAKGIRNVDSLHLITYHPAGAKAATDALNEAWLDFDMFQSGHSRNAKEYNYVLESKKVKPLRPVIEGEARYENIPENFWEAGVHEWLDDSDVRQTAYWTMLAGAAGYTYGCNDIWQMYTMGKHPIINARTGWKDALHLPGSKQMRYLKDLLTCLPWQNMVYDPSIIVNSNPEDEGYMVCAKGNNNDFILVYTPRGRPISVDLSKINTHTIMAYWYNPR